MIDWRRISTGGASPQLESLVELLVVQPVLLRLSGSKKTLSTLISDAGQIDLSITRHKQSLIASHRFFRLAGQLSKDPFPAELMTPILIELLS